MDSKEIGTLIHHQVGNYKNLPHKFNAKVFLSLQRAGGDVKKAAWEIPLVTIDASIQPITRTVLRVRLSIKPNFRSVA